jgi:hypothetical protein
MRQVTRMHRTLTVLAVGLLALAAPLVAYADGTGPGLANPFDCSQQEGPHMRAFLLLHERNIVPKRTQTLRSDHVSLCLVELEG